MLSITDTGTGKETGKDHVGILQRLQLLETVLHGGARQSKPQSEFVSTLSERIYALENAVLVATSESMKKRMHTNSNNALSSSPNLNFPEICAVCKAPPPFFLLQNQFIFLYNRHKKVVK
jgi:hypothetical protein